MITSACGRSETEAVSFETKWRLLLAVDSFGLTWRDSCPRCDTKEDISAACSPSFEVSTIVGFVFDTVNDATDTTCLRKTVPVDTCIQ